MEGSWRLKPSLFVGIGYFLEEGVLVEEGTLPVGNRRTCAISDLFGSCWRRHTRAHFYGMDYSLDQGGRRAHHFSGKSNKGRGHTKLRHISLLGNPKLLLRSFYCIRLLVVFTDHHYIYFHSKLVFPEGGGGLSRVMLTKNTCVHFMHS
jgi:hypothetical protein